VRLNELREAIDQIDQEMLKLFLKRMDVAKNIGIYKKKHQLKVLDEKRESELLEKRRKQLNQDDLWPLYKAFLKETMRLSKAYQKQCIDLD